MWMNGGDELEVATGWGTSFLKVQNLKLPPNLLGG